MSMNCCTLISPRLNTHLYNPINQQLFNFPILDPPFIGREPELEALHSLIAVT